MIGSDDQLKKLNEDIEAFEQACCSVAPTQHKAELKSIRLTDSSPIVGMPLGKTNIQKDYYSMIVKVQRGEDEFIQPGADMVLRPETRYGLSATGLFRQNEIMTVAAHAPRLSQYCIGYTVLNIVSGILQGDCGG